MNKAEPLEDDERVERYESKAFQFDLRQNQRRQAQWNFFFLFFPLRQMDVHCFLLTDILLVCKQTAKKGHGNLKVNTNTSNLFESKHSAKSK
jgi:hypothetical protein